MSDGHDRSKTEYDGSAAPADDGRVRFLRACDRCRMRKIKCTNENPCAKCVAASAVCSFSTQVGNSRTVLSSVETAAREREQPRASGSGSGKRRAEHTPTPAEDKKRKVLDAETTAHFYTSSMGQSHHAGSTSGLPLLEATRRLVPEPSGKAKRAEPDWQWLQDLLQEGSPTANSGNDFGSEDEAEYFPGRDVAPGRPDDQLIAQVTETIPPDLLSELLRVFFSTIHPVWPILHMPTFFNDMARWEDHSFAALVVSMCMLASRYVDDPRVRSDPDNPATAGLGFSELFTRLLDHAVYGDKLLWAIQSRFFGSMFHSVDNVPHPVAQGLLADALSRTLDGGLHRHVSPSVLPSSILREIRSRTAWAVYSWDKQISTICGRPPLSTLWDFDVPLPEPFDDADTAEEHVMHNDAALASTFNNLIQISCVLEQAFLACVHRPIINNSEFLTELSKQLRPDLDDADKLDKVIRALDTWRRTAPPVLLEHSPRKRSLLPGYSVAVEQVAALDHMIRLLVASRQLQLETLSPEPRRDKMETYRAALVHQARDMAALAVQLGLSYQLGKCDILIAYRLLFTGRLLLACVLSARSDNNHAQVEEATKILHATSMTLRNFVSMFPVALGAAEVLDETIRVCRVPPAQTGARSTTQNAKPYAWYRPIVHDSKRPRKSTHSHPQSSLRNQPVDATAALGVVEDQSIDRQTFTDEPYSDLGSAPAHGFPDLSPFDASFAAGNVPMPTFNDPSDPSETDFLWLLPGGEQIPYLHYPPSI